MQAAFLKWSFSSSNKSTNSNNNKKYTLIKGKLLQELMLTTSQESRWNKVIHSSKISFLSLNNFTSWKEFTGCPYMHMMGLKALVMASMESFCNLHNSFCRSHLMKRIKIKIYFHRLSEKEIKRLFCNKTILYNEQKLSFLLELLFSTLYQRSRPNIQAHKINCLEMKTKCLSSSLLLIIYRLKDQE